MVKRRGLFSLLNCKSSIEPISRDKFIGEIVSNKLFILGGILSNCGSDEHEIITFDFKSKKWEEFKTNGLVPVRKTDATSWVIGDLLFVHGGESNGGDLTDELICINTTTKYCTLIHARLAPLPRKSHCACTIYAPGNSFVMVFGGQTGIRPSLTNETFLINAKELSSAASLGKADELQWVNVPLQASTPSKRSGATLVCTSENEAVLFGGFDGTNALNDIHIFNLTTACWTHLKTTGHPTPCPRFGHTAIALPGNQMLIFGGCNKSDEADIKSFNDAFILHIETCKWTKLSYGSLFPSPRSFHQMCLYYPLAEESFKQYLEMKPKSSQPDPREIIRSLTQSKRRRSLAVSASTPKLPLSKMSQTISKSRPLKGSMSTRMLKTNIPPTLPLSINTTRGTSSSHIDGSNALNATLPARIDISRIQQQQHYSHHENLAKTGRGHGSFHQPWLPPSQSKPPLYNSHGQLEQFQSDKRISVYSCQSCSRKERARDSFDEDSAWLIDDSRRDADDDSESPLFPLAMVFGGKNVLYLKFDIWSLNLAPSKFTPQKVAEWLRGDTSSIAGIIHLQKRLHSSSFRASPPTHKRHTNSISGPPMSSGIQPNSSNTMMMNSVSSAHLYQLQQASKVDSDLERRIMDGKKRELELEHVLQTERLLRETMQEEIEKLKTQLLKKEEEITKLNSRGKALEKQMDVELAAKDGTINELESRLTDTEDLMNSMSLAMHSRLAMWRNDDGMKHPREQNDGKSSFSIET